LTREQPTRYDADNSGLIIAQASVVLTAHRIYWRREYPVYVWSAVKRAVLSLCPTADGDVYIAAEISVSVLRTVAKPEQREIVADDSPKCRVDYADSYISLDKMSSDVYRFRAK
ncbi:hypothetical protein FOZ63_013774, partial [Perkinsus olseni]